MKKAVVVMVLVSLGNVFLPGRAEAKNKYEKQFLSQFHSDFGIELYKEKKYEQAIDQFSKVLLLNNSDSVASEYLRKIAKEKDLWPGGYNHSLLRFIDLVEYNDFLKSRVTFLNTNNDMLVSFILSRGNYDPAVTKEAKEIQSVIKTRYPNPEQETHHVTLEQLKSKADINAFTEALLSDKVDLLQVLEELQTLNRQLRTVKRDVIGHIGESRKKEQFTKIDGQLETIQTQLIAKDAIIDQQTKQYNLLNDDLKKVNGEFSLVQARLQEAEKKIGDLTKDLAGMSLESMEKSKLLAQKDARLVDLEKDLVEAQERLSLVQRIIKEKDDHILMIEEEMASVENKLEGHEELTRSAVDTLVEQTQGSKTKIDDLQKQFSELSTRYKQAEKEMKARDDKIRDLQKSLEHQNGALANYKRAFFSKDQQLLELNGIVQIYKSKLIDAASDLKSKDKELDRLEKQINDLDLRLQDVKLNETKHDASDFDILSRTTIQQTSDLIFVRLAQTVQ